VRWRHDQTADDLELKGRCVVAKCRMRAEACEAPGEVTSLHFSVLIAIHYVRLRADTGDERKPWAVLLSLMAQVENGACLASARSRGVRPISEMRHQYRRGSPHRPVISSQPEASVMLSLALMQC
jgi:hypothetical protein